MNAPVISVRQLSTRFARRVHRQLNLEIHAGDMVALVGGSGSGKTTLLRQMIGLLIPTEGEDSPVWRAAVWRRGRP